MAVRRLRAWLPFTAVLLLGACEDDLGPDLSDLPSASGGAVWSFLQEEDYDARWSLWPGKGRMYESTSPEHGVRLTTYVNDIALDAINDDRSPLPAGSMVVKEAYQDGSLMAVTTMYKVQGFAPGTNDWFWLMNDPAGTVVAEGSVDMCIGCHTAARETDYLFLMRE